MVGVEMVGIVTGAEVANLVFAVIRTRQRTFGDELSVEVRRLENFSLQHLGVVNLICRKAPSARRASRIRRFCSVGASPTEPEPPFGAALGLP